MLLQCGRSVLSKFEGYAGLGEDMAAMVMDQKWVVAPPVL